MKKNSFDIFGWMHSKPMIAILYLASCINVEIYSIPFFIRVGHTCQWLLTFTFNFFFLFVIWINIHIFYSFQYIDWNQIFIVSIHSFLFCFLHCFGSFVMRRMVKNIIQWNNAKFTKLFNTKNHASSPLTPLPRKLNCLCSHKWNENPKNDDDKHNNNNGKVDKKKKGNTKICKGRNRVKHLLCSAKQKKWIPNIYRRAKQERKQKEEEKEKRRKTVKNMQAKQQWKVFEIEKSKEIKKWLSSFQLTDEHWIKTHLWGILYDLRPHLPPQIHWHTATAFNLLFVSISSNGFSFSSFFLLYL